MKGYKGLLVFSLFFGALMLSAATGHSYTITAAAGPGGSITPSGQVSVDAGNDQVFTITTDPGYTVLAVIVDNVTFGAPVSYTFNNVTADHSIRVLFACNTSQLKLDWDSSLHDTITEAYDYAVFYGLTDITLQMAGTVIEDLYFDLGISVRIEGGYDCSFVESYPITKMLGSMTIAGGTINASKLGIAAPAYCANGDPDNFPGNPEICDGLDNNCNGLADEDLSFDDDGDGYSALGSCAGSADDCNDNDAGVHPGAVEIPHDGIDQDCDGQDLVFSEANYCSNCHGAPSTWNALHASVTAPDGTCADCHAVPVSNILPGHYGNTVRTAGNNMEAGAAINCYSCHDDHGVEQPFTPFDGDNIVWAKVAADGRGNVSCDTCHENRAAEHATGTAHDYREIDPTCANCHTSDTSVLGSPGTGTLVSDEDVDTLHRSDCNLCHTYSGTKIDPSIVEQAIWDGLYGIQIYCLDCHTDKATGHGAPVSGKHPEHLEMAGVSCDNCHESGNIPYFKSGTDSNGDNQYDLGEADVCDTCHQVWSAGLPPEEDHKSGWPMAGFTVDCAICHAEHLNNGDNVPFGGRRAVIGEFPASDSHAHYGAAIDATSCQVCHNYGPAIHMNGTVNLLDPDGGAGYDFIYVGDITSDPDVSDFCANCHDDNGATRLAQPLDPFINGNAPPDVATKFKGTLQFSEWYGDSCFGYEGSNRPVNSHHDISDTDQAFSGAKLECLSCHGAHISAESQKIMDPYNANMAWTGTLNEFCLSCHTGGLEAMDASFPPDVVGPTFYTAPPANAPGDSCGAAMVYDCSDSCVDQSVVTLALSNGSCNDSAGLDLDCYVFSFDNGECTPVNTPNTSCGVDMVWDCGDSCVDLTTLNAAFGGTCDKAAGLDLNCAEFEWDNNSCTCLGNDCSTIGGIDSCGYDFSPWWIEMPWSNEAHGNGSKRQWQGYSGAPAVPAMDCVACHDSHGSYVAVTNEGGNPYMLRDFVDGSQFNDDGIRGAVTNVPGTAGNVVITSPTPETIGPMLGSQLCVKCHADWLAAYSWHSFCNGCLTCHSHGMAWGASDWGDGADDAAPLWCP